MVKLSWLVGVLGKKLVNFLDKKVNFLDKLDKTLRKEDDTVVFLFLGSSNDNIGKFINNIVKLLVLGLDFLYRKFIVNFLYEKLCYLQ